MHALVHISLLFSVSFLQPFAWFSSKPTSTTNIARRLTVCTDSGIHRRHELGDCTKIGGSKKTQILM